MFGVLGQIMSGVSKAREYDSKKRQATQNAKLTRMRGDAAQEQAYEEARSIYETDKSNKDIRAQQQRQARGKQRQEQSAARNMGSGSGVNVEQGVTLEDEVRREWDAQIDNMAQSSSIMHINAMQRALNEKRGGEAEREWAEVEAIGYDYEAEQYRRLAKRTRSGLWLDAVVSGVSAVAGAYGGYNALDSAGNKLGMRGAMQGMNSYGTMGWDVSAAMNPYTSSYQVNPKMSWSNFADLLSGRGAKI